ncbi:UDP-glucose 4-epimerase GalE [Synechococcus sp. HK05]|uniref:UDP-glucose 4-epimerase GalE n=1 Tax=Synechococcus sp. HK05 TaxID=2725975 RepID=UPI001C385F4F|nr:UDP-glucose 4-epimerase GalE [Synechococcus sp. HK05]MBV2350324.1 UDP-glucose 4-epimerase GalE [Synechococcus sp. HK05]
MHPLLDSANHRVVMVVGGAGYLGSHVARALSSAGFGVVLLDNLSTGHVDLALSLNLPLVEASLGDAAVVEALLSGDHPATQNRPIAAVVHCAASDLGGCPDELASLACQANLENTMVLLDACARAGQRSGQAAVPIVLSSSASVYGPSDEENEHRREGHAVHPLSASGYCHWINEQLLADLGRDMAVPHVILRCFSVAGADPQGGLGEDHLPETHLIPSILEAMSGRRMCLELYGVDYPTPDGSPIRDFIHVCDVAEAHVLAVRRVLNVGGSHIYNIGTGTGHSVLQVVEAAKALTGHGLLIHLSPRRRGDIAHLVADPRRARQELGWRLRYSNLQTILQHAWLWHRFRFANDLDRFVLRR